MSGVYAKFEQHDIDGQRTGFVVTPARSYSSKLAMVAALGFAFAVFTLFRVEDDDLLGTIRLVIMLVGGWWVAKWMHRRSEAVALELPGGQFVASFGGIELAGGEFISREQIIQVETGMSSSKGRLADVSYVLRVCTKSGVRDIVGGMDMQTADELLDAVIKILGSKVINPTSS